MNPSFNKYHTNVKGTLSTKDKRGSVTRYRYDDNRRLVEKRTPLELDASGNVVYAVETYGYDSIGNVTKRTLKSSADDTFVRETTTTYYDNNLVRTVSDNAGSLSTRSYDKNGNLIKLETLRDGDIFDVELYASDLENRMTERTKLLDRADVAVSDAVAARLAVPGYSGKVRSVTGYEYDVLGNLVKEIDPRAYAFDAADAANRALYTTTYTYDSLNRLDRTQRIVNGKPVYSQVTYDEVGNRKSVRNERGYATEYTYDAMNRVLTVKDAGGHTLTYVYDKAGNKLSETNARGYSMSYTYDALNRQDTVIDPYYVVITRLVYDANGNVTKRIDAEGYKSGSSDATRYGSTYTYDLAGRVVTELDPELESRNKPGAFTKSYRYNAAGDVISETDALGNESVYAYDAAGRLLSVTDPLGVPVSYSYDKAGNKLFMTDGRGKVTTYSYGAFGALRSVKNASQLTIRYTYDLAGNMARMVDRNGNATEYAYDNRNLLLRKAVEETDDEIEYGYDEVGNRVSMSDESGASVYTFDAKNQVKEIRKDGKLTLAYTYDEIGNILTVRDGSGFTTSYGYDRSSRMAAVTFDGKTTTYAYDANGNRKSVTYDGGVTEQYTYDKVNRLLTLANKKPGGSELSRYSYTYDDAGRQSSMTDSYGKTTYAYDGAGRVTKVVAPGKTTVYGYDKAGNRQSLHETYTSAQPSGFEDPASDKPIEYLVKKSEYLYSPANELLRLVEVMTDAQGAKILEKTVSYLYDANGNELRQKTEYLRPHNRGMRHVTGGNAHGDTIDGDVNAIIEKVSSTFDGFNRLKTTERVKAGERVTVSFTYDGNGLRTRKESRSSKDAYAPKVTTYLYDRQHVILETDASGAVSTRYVRGMNYIARMDAKAKLSYYLFNGHGDVVQTVSAAGDVENRYEYDIFGMPTLTLETYVNAILYAGEFFDKETGLYYLRARYYNPYTGRFISEDSYWGEDRNPLSLNLYTYAHNDPIQYVDPSGHSAILARIAGAVVGAVVNLAKGSEKEKKKSTPTTVPVPRRGNGVAVSSTAPTDFVNAEDEAGAMALADQYVEESKAREKLLEDIADTLVQLDIIINKKEKTVNDARQLIADLSEQREEYSKQYQELQQLQDELEKSEMNLQKTVLKAEDAVEQANNYLGRFSGKKKPVEKKEPERLLAFTRGASNTLVSGVVGTAEYMIDELKWKTYEERRAEQEAFQKAIKDAYSNVVDTYQDPEARIKEFEESFQELLQSPEEQKWEYAGILFVELIFGGRTRLLPRNSIDGLPGGGRSDYDSDSPGGGRN